LVVDANAELSLAIAAELLKPMARKVGNVPKARRRIEAIESALRLAPESFERLYAPAGCKIPSSIIPISQDHIEK
jgi:hypothetical protein